MKLTITKDDEGMNLRFKAEEDVEGEEMVSLDDLFHLLTFGTICLWQDICHQEGIDPYDEELSADMGATIALEFLTMLEQTKDAQPMLIDGEPVQEELRIDFE